MYRTSYTNTFTKVIYNFETIKYLNRTHYHQKIRLSQAIKGLCLDLDLRIVSEKRIQGLQMIGFNKIILERIQQD